MTTHNHVLLTELLSNILRSAAAHFNPGPREESTSAQNEGKVENSVERIQHQFSDGTRRRDIIGKA
jgi:hypothetical protein